MTVSIEFASPTKIIFVDKIDHYSYFIRSTIREYLHFATNLIKERSPGGLTVLDYEVAPGNIFKITCCKIEDICIVIITNISFSISSVRYMINELMKIPVDTMTETILNEFIKTHQDPKTFDNIVKIKDQLSDIHTVMLKNIDEILKRGELLTDLVEKSHQLSINAKAFQKQAKKMNSCCAIL